MKRANRRGEQAMKKAKCRICRRVWSISIRQNPRNYTCPECEGRENGEYLSIQAVSAKKGAARKG